MKRKKVRSYWWDLEGEDEVIVESDDPLFPIVARFKYDPNGGVEAEGIFRILAFQCGLGTKMGQAVEAIEKAEKLISDLNAGRVSPRKIS